SSSRRSCSPWPSIPRWTSTTCPPLSGWAAGLGRSVARLPTPCAAGCAAPLGAQLQQACAARIGCPVGQGYGMTEATAGIALFPVGAPVVPGSSGPLLPGIRARITDPGTGADLAPGPAGELWVRTPAVMTGYLGNPAASAATIDDDGWLHTGDIARFDAEGNLFLLDRVKELIKVKGFQVAPAELE